MTELEARVLDLVIEWREAKYAVAEALIRQELMRTVDMLKKERRDAKAQTKRRSEADDL